MMLPVLSSAGNASTDTSRTTKRVSQSASEKVTPTKNWRSLDIGQERWKVENWHLKKRQSTASDLHEGAEAPVKGQKRDQEIEMSLSFTRVTTFHLTLTPHLPEWVEFSAIKMYVSIVDSQN